MVRVRVILMGLIALLSARVPLAGADTQQRVFHPDIRTVQVYATAGGKLSDPVVILGSEDGALTVEFDEIASDRRYMRYSLTHCDARWEPSALVESEYLEGFNEGTVEEYEFSRATTVQYVHYRLTLPNDQVRFTLSGNYLLKVYDEEDPESALFQVRFKVVEPLVTLADSRVSGNTDIDYNNSHQQLSFSLDVDDLRVRDYLNDLTIVVDRNNIASTEVYLKHPLSVRGGKLVYEHLPELIFDAGNEYRRFETVSTRMPGMNVAEVGYHAPYYHAWVGPDTPRADVSYLYDSTQHGRYLVREYNSDESDVEADYVVTHFSLGSDPLPGKKVAIEGDLVNRLPEGRAIMEYNHETGCYETALLLKQGSYNYMYVVMPDGDAPAGSDFNMIEGNFYNTTNEYHLSVYYRPVGQRYDRLVGYFIIRI